MPIICFVSSVGDADLAKEAIKELKKAKPDDLVYVLPLTAVAAKRVGDFDAIKLSLAEITKNPDILLQKKITHDELAKLSEFIKESGIQSACVGVPSPSDDEIAFQIAASIKIPCVIAYEFMFSAPLQHQFWPYFDTLAENKNCVFAVPLKAAKAELEMKNAKVRVHPIGHLCIDRAKLKLTKDTVEVKTEIKVDTTAIRTSLAIKEGEELTFISGTTRPTKVDADFLDALLSAVEKFPTMQLRLGIHPGVADVNKYLEEILNVCAKHPNVKNQFKIILPPSLKKSLDSDYFLRVAVTGADAAQAADKITQAVPGALLNEAALRGKPVYYHEREGVAYLPEKLFAKNINHFFNAKPQASCTLDELEISGTAPSNLAKLLMSG